MSVVNVSAKLTSEVGSDLENAVAKLNQLTQELATADHINSTFSHSNKLKLDAARLELEADRQEWEATRSRSCGGGSLGSNKAELEVEKDRIQLRLVQIKIKTAQSQLEDSKSKLEAARFQLEKVRSQLETARDHLKVAKTRTTMEVAKASFEAAKIRFESAIEQLKEAKSKFEDAKTQLKTAAEDTSNITMTCQLGKHISNLQNKICQLEDDLKENRSTIQCLETANSQLKKDKHLIEKLLQDQELEAQNSSLTKLNNPTVFLDITIHGKKTGRITMELFADTNPLAAENFRALCTGEKGVSRNGTRLHYKGIPFDFICPELFIDGGDITGKNDGTSGESIYGTSIPIENFIKKHNGAGDLSLSSMNQYSSHGSKFVISVGKNSDYDGRLVVIGKMIRGMDVLNGVVKAFRIGQRFVKGDLVIADCGQL